MAPRSAVVIQHKGATIYINNEELLKSVVVALGLAPCDSAGHSLAKSSTASASDAEMFEIFSDKSVENAEQGVQACQALPLMLDAQTQTDVSPDLECVESSCDAEVQVDGHASAPLVRMVAEAQTQTSSSVVEAGSQTSEDVFDFQVYVPPVVAQVGMMTCEPMVSLEEASALMDLKLGPALKAQEDLKNQLLKDLDKVSSDRDDVVLKLNRVTSDYDVALKKLKQLESLFDEASDDLTFDKKKKKGKQR
eukprot:TRINITY_DN5703_c0_g2_i2.p1 TRINITY_DN5703_c0_g2~~TRINITY_DN5703_c0_g2_i2.p1  ORF type:complete len:250 (+),score=58.27 TRINITY_DN5703_c0_g2_i2:89-838(+)